MQCVQDIWKCVLSVSPSYLIILNRVLQPCASRHITISQKNSVTVLRSNINNRWKISCIFYNVNYSTQEQPLNRSGSTWCAKGVVAIVATHYYCSIYLISAIIISSFKLKCMYRRTQSVDLF